MLLPEIIEIEIVKGLCSADCPMCCINETRFDKKIMTYEKFTEIVDSFGTNIENVKKVILCGIGEALLDKTLGPKIKYLKSKGIELICVPTNASHLTEDVATEILDAGIDELIIAIDSLKKEVFEGIRKGLVFEQIIKNTHRYIDIRDAGNYDSAVMIRMITSHRNVDEWDDYVEYWSKCLNFLKGDMFLRFPEHNWSEHDYPNAGLAIKPKIDHSIRCEYVSDRYNIDVNGQMKLCCIDVNADFFKLGNVLRNDPVELINSEQYNDIRRLMNDGKREEILPCSKCDTPNLRSRRTYSDDGMEFSSH